MTPAKVTSIPRLELLSCVLLSNLIDTVINAWKPELSVDRITCWTDSQVALSWIKGCKKEWKPWVENRVCKIREKTDIRCWRHVPGEQNPADLATREGRIIEMINERWWQGPEFLRSTKSDWPTELTVDKSILDACFLEAKKSTISDWISDVNLVGVLADSSKLSSHRIDKSIDFNRFNSFQKLCQTTAYVFRFVQNIKNSIKKTELVIDDEIKVAEVREAQRKWLKCVQEKFYEDGKIQQLTTSLRLYEDEYSILRSKTRLSEADISDEAKYPIVLPNNHPVTDMIIFDAHKEVMHSGENITLSRVGF